MLNSSDMDTFLAGLSEDCYECYTKSSLEQYVNQFSETCTYEEIHTNLEKYFVIMRKNKGLPEKDPKPYSAEIKKKPTVVYNRWTQEELDKYVLSKTASVQSKLDDQLIATLYLAAASPTVSFVPL